MENKTTRRTDGILLTSLKRLMSVATEDLDEVLLVKLSAEAVPDTPPRSTVTWRK